MTRQTPKKLAKLAPAAPAPLSGTNRATADLALLWDMLHTMRPAGSKAEQAFVVKYLDSVAGMQADGFGNRYLRIGEAPVLWSSHTDTVHRDGGAQSIRHNNRGLIRLARQETANCLGADCTAGVWIMLEMIKHNVPGLYIFHREEEVGGIGSQWIADNAPELLAGIQIAIAFDRRGFDSIITEQAGGRCASDNFAASLAYQLPGFSPDNTGLFTDTANYIHLVPECTNLSVGYENAHSRDETLDCYFLSDLRDSIFSLDISKLKVERKPAPKVSRVYGAGRNSGAWAWGEDFELADWQPAGGDRAARNTLEFCQLYPEAVADLLDQYGIDVSELYQAAPWLQ